MPAVILEKSLHSLITVASGGLKLSYFSRCANDSKAGKNCETTMVPFILFPQSMPFRTVAPPPEFEQLSLLYFRREQLDIAIKSLEAIQRLRENRRRTGIPVRDVRRRCTRLAH